MSIIINFNRVGVGNSAPRRATAVDTLTDRDVTRLIEPETEEDRSIGAERKRQTQRQTKEHGEENKERDRDR